MEEGQTTNATSVNDVNVPTVTVNLEMLTIDNSCSSSVETKRVLRKRIPKHVSTEISNRRCTMGPKKRTFSEMDNSKEGIKEYYLDKNIKKRSNNLETIYEESDNINDDSTIRMSVKRFKRMLLFTGEPTTTKLKKRRARIRRTFGSGIRCNKRCISMQTLTDKLNTIKESLSKIENELE